MLVPPKVKPLGAALAVCLIGATLLVITALRPVAIGIDRSCQPRFVRLTSGWVSEQYNDAMQYMHRFYVRSQSFSPMRWELFESLEDCGFYRGALQRGTFTVCEREVWGSNAVLWVGYEAVTPFNCSNAGCLSSPRGKAIRLTEMENRRIPGTDRYIWSAVCSAAPKSGEEYTLELGRQHVFLCRSP